ncbi:EAL domain-containing protein [Hoeflea poritis]|uniref:EAL domain-containing protein n=1 Tax=Hoeflea poritis TaxID=2993659 RepID=A0ABT4VRF6_9HYPH|nr:EAL domain-containing protein [Hoeflea poritis]MDA4847300.1 EAL domain-containing protein [Hoeflea poritis]
MAGHNDSGRILPEANGTCTGSFGPFVLKTALQPILGRESSGMLVLRGLEGLLRLFLNGRPFGTAEFLARVGQSERVALDALCRQIHLINASAEPSSDALLFLNFDPSIYESNRQIAAQVSRLQTDVGTNGFSPRNIVCEMTEQPILSPARMRYLTESLREGGFRIAVDDFGAESSDSRRVDQIRPEFIKFDAKWVARLMESPSGFDTLKDAVARFRQGGAAIVIEGLEQDFQVDLAWGAGADLVQGYALARPQLTPTNFSRLFRRGAA